MVLQDIEPTQQLGAHAPGYPEQSIHSIETSPKLEEIYNQDFPSILTATSLYIQNTILFTINSTLLLGEELWQVAPPIIMTQQNPCLMLFLTEYGIQVMEYFIWRKHSIQSQRLKVTIWTI